MLLCLFNSLSGLPRSFLMNAWQPHSQQCINHENQLDFLLSLSLSVSHDKPSFCSTWDSDAFCDKYLLSRNGILLHAPLEAQTHDSVGYHGCWQCVTWNSCSKYLTEGMFMHDEFAGQCDITGQLLSVYQTQVHPISVHAHANA